MATECTIPFRSAPMVITASSLSNVWRGAAARQTFDKLDAVITIGADRNGIVHSVAMAPAINSRRRTQIFHQPITIGHGTTEGAADADMRFSCRLLAKHRIKRNQLEDVDRLQTEFRSNPEHAVVADKSEVFLPQV